MMISWLLAATLALVVAALLAARRAPRLWHTASVGGALAAGAAAIMVLIGGATWETVAPFAVAGNPVHLKMDALSAFFLLLLAVVSGAGSVYSGEYWSDQVHPRSAPTARFWWSLMTVAMQVVLLSTDGLHFLFAWEAFTVSAYFLITSERSRSDVRAAGRLYFVASHAGTLCLIAFFAGLAAGTGSWALGPMRHLPDLAPLFWLALLGFGIKAGVFPLHVWLPSAHASAPSHVSALLSGMAIKMGIYGLVRFSGWLAVPVAAGWTVAGLGVASAVLGVAFALAQHDLKRLLAYHSVENIGIILIGLGFAMIATDHGHAQWGRLALAGGLLHVWNHGLFKSLLFLSGGAVVHATGTRVMSRLGGLWRPMPWTAGLFVLGAAAIAGLPPLNGFVSEWLVFLSLFDSLSVGDSAAWAAVCAAVLLGVTGALALACFVKVCGIVWLGSPRSAEAAHAHECGWRMRLPMLVLGTACVSIGLAPTWFWAAVTRASTAWNPAWPASAPPAPLAALGTLHLALALCAVLAVLLIRALVTRRGVTRALTWDCGFAHPTARMQYTAGSFAGIISGWFEWILRPERHVRRPSGMFPAEASLEAHTPETVLVRVVEPAGSMVMRVSGAVRRLQHGRVQAYMLYLLIGLAALALLAVAGARS
jgi:hydrogenase-4 component B